jgi:glycolate oxidase FAD binding subunit
MSHVVAPTSIAELVEAVRSHERVVAIGARSKPRLSDVAPEYVRLTTTSLAGITEYEPDEFTFTALAGTPVREVVKVLAQSGQYLPFDPLFVQAGATLGGTVAAGTSGPGRLRYGALRDFILGVRFVDGEGRLLRLGGRVVKNAAGFDVPKFLVGSTGCFAVMAELTFKVFPRPAAVRTLRLDARDVAAKTRHFAELAAGRWEFDALDAPVAEAAVYARLAGPAEALEPQCADVLARYGGAVMPAGEATAFWPAVTEMRWAHSGGTLLKVSLSLRELAAFVECVRRLPDARGWISGGGNAGYVSLPPTVSIADLPFPAVTLRGNSAAACGSRFNAAVAERVKRVFDPAGRFPPLPGS